LKVAVSAFYPVLLTLSSIALVAPEVPSGTFVLTSAAFEDNAPLPRKFAGKSQTNKYCVGKNISPPLGWRNPLKSTKSFALLLFDPEGHDGLGTVHWVAYGLESHLLPGAVFVRQQASTANLRWQVGDA
jgi:phosphatidylethanolamine-binding protein (PEBP) family uncharacterized protein